MWARVGERPRVIARRASPTHPLTPLISPFWKPSPKLFGANKLRPEDARARSMHLNAAGGLSHCRTTPNAHASATAPMGYGYCMALLLSEASATWDSPSPGQLSLTEIRDSARRPEKMPARCTPWHACHRAKGACRMKEQLSCAKLHGRRRSSRPELHRCLRYPCERNRVGQNASVREHVYLVLSPAGQHGGKEQHRIRSEGSEKGLAHACVHAYLTEHSEQLRRRGLIKLSGWPSTVNARSAGKI